ncbi:MAG: response regulator [Planctomycetes bacterium]|nr:response regulator [Planctomycetota bacterium]
MRLLIVDDETHVCEGIAALLRARGYDVELCFTGEAVLERVASEPLPDLVLLDYELPGVDGEEVLTRLRSDPRTAHLPVLMATASQIDLARLRRVSGLLRKPYSREVLFTMIAQLLARVEAPPRAP